MEDDFDRQRDEMIEDQIRKRGIHDALVLKAMSGIKRHLFVPSQEKKFAYSDTPLPIGMNQTISQPYIVALMTEMLELKGSERVLEIGTGSGYQTALLAHLAAEVYTIEMIEDLAAGTRKLLDGLGYRNIRFRTGDGRAGWPEQAPFDAIIVTCAPDTIPEILFSQLAEGGNMVVPVGREHQSLKMVRKVYGKLEAGDVLAVRFVPMLNFFDKEA